MSDTRSHIESIELDAPADKVFECLYTPSAIRAWWKADRAIVVARPQGLWMAAWGENEDDPDYISSGHITVFDPPRLMVLADPIYYARIGGPPFQAEMTTSFEVVSIDPDRSVLRVVQDGFPAGPEADEFYAACERGWKDTLANIKAYLA